MSKGSSCAVTAIGKDAATQAMKEAIFTAALAHGRRRANLAIDAPENRLIDGCSQSALAAC
jgi:hypothetical protein